MAIKKTEKFTERFFEQENLFLLSEITIPVFTIFLTKRHSFFNLQIYCSQFLLLTKDMWSNTTFLFLTTI